MVPCRYRDERGTTLKRILLGLALAVLALCMGATKAEAYDSRGVGTCPSTIQYYGCVDALNSIDNYQLAYYNLSSSGFWLRDNLIDCWHNSAWTNVALYARCGVSETWVKNTAGGHGMVRGVYIEYNLFHYSTDVKFFPNVCVPLTMAPTYSAQPAAGYFGTMSFWPMSEWNAPGDVQQCFRPTRYSLYDEYYGYDF